MSQASFKELPFAIILEICSYLNVETLIAMADVSHNYAKLARGYLII
jgi:F-box domain